MRKGRPQILEPIMKVEVICAGRFMGPVLGDLKYRRGRAGPADGTRYQCSRSRAFVPLSNMFGNRY